MWLKFVLLPCFAFSASLDDIRYILPNQLMLQLPDQAYQLGQGQCEGLWYWKSEILWHKLCSNSKSQKITKHISSNSTLSNISQNSFYDSACLNTKIYHMDLICEKMWLSAWVSKNQSIQKMLATNFHRGFTADVNLLIGWTNHTERKPIH